MPTINTTQTAQTTKPETLEQGIDRVRAVFDSAPRKKIRIIAVEGDKTVNTIEGGVNGYMFSLQRGVAIDGVPQPILEVLDNAGIDYNVLAE